MTRDPVLIGLPAAGKTAVGRLLADHLGCDFVDTDALVTAELGLTLPEAWASLPSADLEAVIRRCCLEALARGGVVALSSAAITDPAVRDALPGRRVIWLSVSTAQATRRLRMTQWGMAALQLIRAQFDAQAAEREPLFAAAATLVIDTDHSSPDEIVGMILSEGEAT